MINLVVFFTIVLIVILVISSSVLKGLYFELIASSGEILKVLPSIGKKILKIVPLSLEFVRNGIQEVSRESILATQHIEKIAEGSVGIIGNAVSSFDPVSKLIPKIMENLLLLGSVPISVMKSGTEISSCFKFLPSLNVKSDVSVIEDVLHPIQAIGNMMPENGLFDTIASGGKLCTDVALGMPAVAIISGSTQVTRFLALPLKTAFNLINTVSTTVSNISSNVSDISVVTSTLDGVFHGDKIITFITNELSSMIRSPPNSFTNKIKELFESIMRSVGCSLLNVRIPFPNFYWTWSWTWEIWHWIEKLVKRWFDDWRSICHDSECFILTSNGPVKMKDLKIGDLVMTHEKTYEKVVSIIKTHNGAVFLVNGTTTDHPRLLSDGRLVSYTKNNNLSYLDIEVDSGPIEDRNIHMEFKNSDLYTIELEGPIGTYMCYYSDASTIQIYKDISPSFENAPAASVLLAYFINKYSDRISKMIDMEESKQKEEIDDIFYGIYEAIKVMYTEVSDEDKARIKDLFNEKKDEIRETFVKRDKVSSELLGKFNYSLYLLLYLYKDNIPFNYVSAFYDIISKK